MRCSRELVQIRPGDRESRAHRIVPRRAKMTGTTAERRPPAARAEQSEGARDAAGPDQAGAGAAGSRSSEVFVMAQRCRAVQ